MSGVTPQRFPGLAPNWLREKETRVPATSAGLSDGSRPQDYTRIRSHPTFEMKEGHEPRRGVYVVTLQQAPVGPILNRS